MFVRVKRVKGIEYLQVVDNRWEDGTCRQRLVASLGRRDGLQQEGAIDGILQSLARFSERLEVVDAFKKGSLKAQSVLRVGPSLVFGRLWEQTGIRAVLQKLLTERDFDFSVERVAFLSVLHRLFHEDSVSDRQADQWKKGYRIEGTESLELHHLYRGMRWLGDQRERIEEELFDARRDLFSGLNLCFFDTTSIYFEGRGGESIGQYGHSKDHRPDRVQMILGAVLDSEGRPICAPMWPGNKADVTQLRALAHSLRDRFKIRHLNLVADRGMISRETIEALEKMDPPVGYILGAKMKGCKEVRDQVLGRGGRYHEVSDNLQVKEVRVGDHRYVVCLNPEEATRDRETREAILLALEEDLRRGPASLIGNKGYKQYLTVDKGSVRIDPLKVQNDQRYDGKFVLRTSLDLSAEDIAKRYKDLWLVERLFRDVKTLLETRPIYHHWDSTICGHVFVSFLALVLLQELLLRQQSRGLQAEWYDQRRDLDAVQEVHLKLNDRSFLLTPSLRPAAVVAFRSAGVAIPQEVRLA